MEELLQKISEDELFCLAKQQIAERLALDMYDQLDLLAPREDYDRWRGTISRTASIGGLRRGVLFMKQIGASKWCATDIVFLTNLANFLEANSLENISIDLQWEVQHFVNNLSSLGATKPVAIAANAFKQECKSTLETFKALCCMVETLVMDEYDVRGVDGNFDGVLRLFLEAAGGDKALEAYFSGVPLEDILAS